jgi:glycosyltransferase involved in cell wall biosynthesis
MNIGIDLRALLNKVKTGVGEYTDELVTHILATPTEHHFFLFYNALHPAKHLEKYSLYPNVTLVATGWPNKVFNATTWALNIPSIDRIIYKKTKKKIDVFFSPNVNFTALSPTTPHILTIHDISFEFFPEYFSHKQRLWHAAINPRKTAQDAAAIITPSEHTRRDVIDYYGIAEHRVHVVRPGLSSSITEQFNHITQDDLTHLNKKYHLPEKFVLFLGTIEPRKNILTLVRGFEDYKKRSPDSPLHLVIAGATGWNNRELFEYVAHSPFRSAIHHIGYVDSEDKAALYTRASLFVYPSLYEGFGFPVLEAFAAGIPAITSSRTSLTEVGGDAAYYTHPKHPTDIAEGIERISTTPSLRENLVARGYEQAALFSYRTMAHEWLAIAERIAQKKS